MNITPLGFVITPLTVNSHPVTMKSMKPAVAYPERG